MAVVTTENIPRNVTRPAHKAERRSHVARYSLCMQDDGFVCGYHKISRAVVEVEGRPLPWLLPTGGQQVYIDERASEGDDAVDV